MSFYMPEDIAKTRERYERSGIPQASLIYRGRPYLYYIVPPERWPEVPNFFMRMVPDPNIQYLAKPPEDLLFLTISSEVPEAFRPLIVFHEIVELLEIGHRSRDCCRRAAALEVQRARDYFKHLRLTDYFSLRLQFFKDLLAYAESHPDFCSRDQLPALRAAQSVFQTALS